MTRIPGFRRVIRHGDHAAQVQRDVDDEIRFHLEEVTAELVATGLSPDAARREAERRFGDRDAHRRALTQEDRAGVSRQQWRDRFVATITDLRLSARALVREPWFALGVVVTLGVGLAANATMFGVVDRLLLQPPPHVSAAPGMALVHFHRPRYRGPGRAQTSTSWPDFVTLRDSTGVLESAAAFWLAEGSLDRGTAASRVSVGLASGDFFRTLGARPFAGRFFDASEDRMEAPERVAVISHALWAGRFGQDPRMVGRTIRVDDHLYTVMGIAPRGFHGPQTRRVDVWLPLQATAADFLGKDWQSSRNWYWLRIVGRLAPGVDRTTAEARATVVHQAANRAAGKQDSLTKVLLGSIIPARGIGRSLGTTVEGSTRMSAPARVASWLAGVALVVLLIVCANTANLFLARHHRRHREIAVRLAMGVRRSRLVAMLVQEALLLALAAGALGLVLTWWGSRVMRATLLSSYAWDESPLDARVVGFTLAAAVVAACLAGVVPALVASRQDLTAALKSGGRGTGRRRTPLQRGLLIVQAALSVLLLVGAGLFVRSLGNVAGLRLGYDAEQVLVADIDVASRFPGDTAYGRFFDDAEERLRGVPGVTGTALGVMVPFASSWSTDLHLPGRDSLPDIGDGWYINAVSRTWFETMGTRILRGRGFGPGDVRGSERVTVVNRYMASRLWPDEDAIGKCLKVGADTAPCSTVVGVMEDSYRDNLREGAQAQYVVLLSQGTFEAPRMRTIFLRISGDPALVIPRVREQLQGMLPDLPFADVRSLYSLLDGEVQQWRLGAAMFGLFGAIALLVAAIGLYALVAYDVSQRWRELGVRAALGAPPRHLRGLIVRAGVSDAAIGLVVGTAIAFAAAPAMQEMLFEVQPRDPFTFATVAGALLLVAFLAAVAPARRAARITPAEVLQAD